MSDNRTIAIVGAGQMGSRLLQGLLSVPRNRLDVGFRIYAADPSKQSRETVLARTLEVIDAQDTRTRDRVTVHEHVAGFPDAADLAIFAAPSRHRFQNLKDLLMVMRPKAILLEKFMFDRAEQYAEAETLLCQNEIEAWVHCPRPYWPAYQALYERLGPSDLAQISVTGKGYALASNCVHFLDLCRFFNKSLVSTIIIDEETVETGENKRAGYREIFGQMVGLDNNGLKIKLACSPSETPEIIVSVTIGSQTTMVEETGGVWTTCSADGTITDKGPFSPVFASANTAVFEDILNGRRPHLPTYREASVTHLAVLHGLMPHIGDKSGYLPVT